MRISVFGLGYVGCVSAACFASCGHEVIGVDTEQAKVDLIAAGMAPIVEERIGDLVAQTVGSGALRATGDVHQAIAASELALICVGTPSASNGSLSIAYLERVAEQIGHALAEQSHRVTIVFRSTMLPGTCMERLVPILERASGRIAGVGFGVAVNPEFLREGSSVRDFFDPPKTVIGEFDAASGDVVASLYEGLPGEVFRVPIPVAEITKYVDNAFHGLKIGFANELGTVCRALNLDSHEVMKIFLADRKLNISTAYLRPGFAFGGSCLPKDLRGLIYAARQSDVSLPIISQILPSNEDHLRRAVDMVIATGSRRIGLFGLSFKPGTDDLRESPLVELAERLIGKGFDLKIFDSNVWLSRLTGANREFIQSKLPHIADLLTDSVDEVIEHAEVCVVGCTDPDVVAAMDAQDDRMIIDLVRLPDAERRRAQQRYVGIVW